MSTEYLNEEKELFYEFKNYLIKLKKGFTHPLLPSNLQEIALNGVKEGTGNSLSQWINKVDEWINYVEIIYTNCDYKLDEINDISNSWIEGLHSFESFIDSIPKSALRLSNVEQTEEDVDDIVSGKIIISNLLNYFEKCNLYETKKGEKSRSFPPAKRLIGVGFPGGTLYWYSLEVDNFCTYMEKNEKHITNISFKVNKGTIYGIYGPAGYGKISILECITGIRNYSGKIIYFGKKVNDYKSVDKNIAVQWQKSELDPPHITVGEVLKFRRNLSISNMTSESFIDLKKKKDLKINNLPCYYLKILNLFKLLNRDPQLIILDDITRGLTNEEKQKMQHIISNIKKMGKTVLMTSSDFEVVTNICNEVLDLTNI